MANRQGKLTDLLLREEGMGGRKGNLCNGRIPRVWGEQIEQIALRVNQKFLPKLKSASTNNKTRNAMSFPMIKTLIQFTHKSNPERLKTLDELWWKRFRLQQYLYHFLDHDTQGLFWLLIDILIMLQAC